MSRFIEAADRYHASFARLSRRLCLWLERCDRCHHRRGGDRCRWHARYPDPALGQSDPVRVLTLDFPALSGDILPGLNVQPYLAYRLLSAA